MRYGVTLPLSCDHAALSLSDGIWFGDIFGGEFVALALPHQYFIPWPECAAHAHAFFGFMMLLTNICI